MKTTTTLGRALLMTCLLGPLSAYAAESEQAIEGKASNVAVETKEATEIKDAKEVQSSSQNQGNGTDYGHGHSHGHSHD
ncbi:hypothetical protein SAMN05216229_12819 [Geopseudomonas sagittaria]|uniref:Uncharacterized protein n=1 Tax=Geopseudomonas sagittaria TaxID=1135990 RepID=A0A1I5SDF5_9GAMM|nr:hypothetical protein [Pseudomonas sagittaria]SFP45960.1 hypothetical protein SAMN05216229_102384 [Pseudomonas sagittaria]SFP68527.1 hypothetical protein SAMN05216229_104311 [Pseudomonas sagittaria]SFQ51449.1 hypothetical protein SAMN05216229_12819 [Pseudomonas sagittaria]